VQLIQEGYQVLCIDDNSKSDTSLLSGITEITGVAIANHSINLCNLHALDNFFANNTIDAIIHFAAYKSVKESVSQPLTYYNNNLQALINILTLCQKYQVHHFVFSSSCSVYGNASEMPVTENTPLQTPESAYAATKQMGEQIITDFAKSYAPFKAILLRYFNPAGAHPSNCIGENTIGTPMYLVPSLMQAASGKLQGFKVWGNNYNTIDGSCVRDFIHVCDIACAHTLALKHINAQSPSTQVFNLGTGNGVSVLQLINSFEQANGFAIDYEIGPRRSGDVIEVFANNSKAVSELGWQCKYSIHDILKTAWAWEKKSAKQL
jgi:UDP-glucose 4-epimerase